MAYTEKFQTLADQAQAKVGSVAASDVDALLSQTAVALDIRDKEEHDAGHIDGSLNISRGKLEMNVEGVLPDLDARLLGYCTANNRGALLAAAIKDKGYKNAHDIAGGLNAYRKLNTAAQTSKKSQLFLSLWRLGSQPENEK